MAQLIVTAQSDSYMNYKSPDTNYGANSTETLGVYYAGGDKDQLTRVIANFDVSAIPAGTTVIAAKMRRTLTLADPSPHSCKILRCKRAAQWTESGVTWNKYDGVNAWASGGADPNDTDQVTPAPVSYNEASATGDHEITGLGGFVRDALDNRGGTVSIVMKNENEAPPVSQRSTWLAGGFWKLIIDYDPVGVVGGRSVEDLVGERPSGAARPHRPVAAQGPALPHRATRPRGGSS